jgi:hypothetical protein
MKTEISTKNKTQIQSLENENVELKAQSIEIEKLLK